MLGAIAGDIIGSIYERHNTTRYDFELFTKQSTFTDDTVMTVAMMDHILSFEPLPDALRKWYERYPRRGYGPGFRAWIGGHAKGMSRGNGAAMRTSPLAWVHYEIDEMQDLVTAQARITHNSAEGIAAAEAVALAVRLGRDGYESHKILKLVDGWTPGFEHLKWPPSIKNPGALARESVPVALAAALNSTSFEDAIRKAVSVGGDSDTIASIAGAVAEAMYGRLPDNILQEVQDRLPDDLLHVIDSFYHYWGYPVALRSKRLKHKKSSGAEIPKALALDTSTSKAVVDGVAISAPNAVAEVHVGKRTSGRPLPDDHPFKGGLILFGSGIPEAWKEGFRKKKMREQAREQSSTSEELPSARRDPDDLEAQAFNDYEEALTGSIEEKVRDTK